MDIIDEIEAMEMEDDVAEFTLAEILELERFFKVKEKPISQEFCQEISTKFSCSTHRSGRPPIKGEQVQNWFQDRQANLAVTVTPPSSAHKETVGSKAIVLKKRDKVPTISVNEAAAELPNLMFEARSAKDSAWFDVGTFLTYRVLSSGELEIRARFAGFGKEEDEWVSVKKAIRERSVPLEPSECVKVNVGDLVLCFREADDADLYVDAHVVDIERKPHDSSGVCSCVFVVRYDSDNVEGKLDVGKICRRPTKPVPGGNEGCKAEYD